MGGQPGRGEALEQAPAREAGGAGLVDVVRGERVAGEGGALEQQDPASATREQHRGGGAGAAGADDDRVVHLVLLWCDP